MFNTDAVNRIYTGRTQLLDRVLELERALQARFYGMESAVRCMMLAAMAGEAMVMIGPPGTAKSRLIRAFCSLVGVLDRDPRLPPKEVGAEGVKRDEAYFEYLLTQFTEPSELFGYFDLAKLSGSDPKLERMVHGQMQRAEVVFLDEVFNASSAILNALLTFMNERKFHDRGVVHDTRLRMLFAATNHPPREEGLGAVYDRFLLRCRIENSRPDHETLAHLLGAAWTETHSHGTTRQNDFAGILGEFDTYRETIDEMTTGGDLRIDPTSRVLAAMASIVATVRSRDPMEMSNRRLVKFSAIVLAQAMLRARAAGSASAAIEVQDLGVLLDYGFDQPDPGMTQKLRQNLVLA